MTLRCSAEESGTTGWRGDSCRGSLLASPPSHELGYLASILVTGLGSRGKLRKLTSAAGLNAKDFTGHWLGSCEG